MGNNQKERVFKVKGCPAVKPEQEKNSQFYEAESFIGSSRTSFLILASYSSILDWSKRREDSFQILCGDGIRKVADEDLVVLESLLFLIFTHDSVGNEQPLHP
jgi:hypothetical protein